VKKLFVFLGCAAAGLFACRALVGIDDLQFAPDAGDHHDNKQNDGGPQQNDGGTSGGVDFDAKNRDCQNAPDAGCRKCCKDGYTLLHTTFEDPSGPNAGHDCMCGPTVCATDCKSELCAQPPVLPAGGPTPDNCIICFDSKLAPLCGSTCGDDRECKAAVECLQGCPPGGP
jgi:hypothetical protein